MKIHGSYCNKMNQMVEVSINCRTSTASDMEIGDDKSGIYFTDDPVEITSQVNDSFDHLLCYQASVRLLCKDYIPAFFCNSCFSATVNIFVDGENVFTGFIEPQAFSQGFNEDMDEVELTCIDCLCALQYYNYKFIGSEAVSYATVKANAKQRSLGGILQEVLGAVSGRTEQGGAFPVYYDGSKAIDKDDAHHYTIFDDISVSELLFLDDEESSVWTMEDVLTEILKYLNLHIMQMGAAFYVFSWESIRSASGVTFRNVIGGGTLDKPKLSQNIGNDIVANCDTQISISGTYNQFVLTDNVKEIENVVDSPLEDKSITTAGNYQKFMTELISEGNGESAFYGMKDMCLSGTTDYDGASTVDWFMWPKSVGDWRFYGCGNRSDIYSKYPVNGTNQQSILTEGMTSGIGACVCAFGKIEHKNAKGDNSPVTSVNMENYLIVSTMGNTGKPTATEILNACPVAEYTGNKSGGTFSPADDSTTNYIVISGKMVLNPVMEVTGTFGKMGQASSWQGTSGIASFLGNTVPSRNDTKYGRYYARKYWKAAKWNDEVALDDATNAKDAHSTFYPFTGTGPQDYEFNYSAVGKQEDTIKKVGLLACMLVIGNKCVVEKQKGEDLGTGVAGTGEGEPQDFVWMDYKERSLCSSDDEYYQQSFTIGIDPKLGDKILGTEFDIQKNAPYTLGITAEGTAIPIKMGDKVSGQVVFKILGPVNAEWNNITRRHPSFWRHTQWNSEGVSLLEKTNAILMKDFKVEVVSDNGKIGAVSDESDIVYMSDTMEGFVNKKDDLEFKITTALTSAECKNLGVNNAVKLSSPQNVVTGNALLTIYDRTSGVEAKPEQLYVDAYYQEWHTPRVEMTQSFAGNMSVSLFHQFTHPAIGKRFFVQGFDYNPTDGISKAMMKETF